MTDDICGRTAKSTGEPCQRPAGWGTDNDSGACKFHGGATEGAGAPEGNQNAARHQIHSDPANVLDDLAENDPEAYEWVERKFDSYIEHAPFEPGSAKADQLRRICAQEYVEWRNIGHQLKDGVIVQTHEVAPNGEMMPVDEESPRNLALDRMQRTITRRLKELGVLDDPDSQRANATATLAERLAQEYEGTRQ